VTHFRGNKGGYLGNDYKEEKGNKEETGNKEEKGNGELQGVLGLRVWSSAVTRVAAVTMTAQLL
jgi:hypothetical protein